MKRFIIASASTLVLSLLCAFGANQYATSYGRTLDSNLNATHVESNVTNTLNDQILPGNIQTKVVAIATEATSNNINQENTVPTDQSGYISIAATKNTVRKNMIKKAVKKAAINNNNSSTGKSGQAILYKNVDLSQCKSVNDVVKVLQQNGYSNINQSNIKNIKSLQSILSQIKGKCSAKQSTGATPSTTPKTTATPALTPAAKPTAVPTAAPKVTATPSVTKTPTPTATAGNSNTGISSYAQEVLRLVNVEREKAGLASYITNSTLTAAANKRAKETVQSFSHTRPDGTGFQTVLSEYGITYRAAGENIAYGQKTPQEVVTAWMNSPGHRANILNANFGKIGIGVYQVNGVIYWTQEFTN